MKISNKVQRRIELAWGKLKVERILSEQYVDLMTRRHPAADRQAGGAETG